MEIEEFMDIIKDYDDNYSTHLLNSYFHYFSNITSFIENFINEFIPNEIENYPEGEEEFMKYVNGLKALNLDKLEEEYRVIKKFYDLT